jgi:hypothetical protein
MAQVRTRSREADRRHDYILPVPSHDLVLSTESLGGVIEPVA